MLPALCQLYHRLFNNSRKHITMLGSTCSSTQPTELKKIVSLPQIEVYGVVKVALLSDWRQFVFKKHWIQDADMSYLTNRFNNDRTQPT